MLRTRRNTGGAAHGRHLTSRQRTSRRVTGLLLVAVLASLGLTACGGTSPAGGYLALGDSVVFGYQPPEATPKPNYQDPASFVGYPELLAPAKHLTLTNASCAGETTASLLTAGAQSNGCENSVGSAMGYRTSYPLHVKYTGTQQTFAINFLKTHPDTRAVTIGVGANDAFVCQATTASKCTGSDFLKVTTTITDNVVTLVNSLRNQGSYHGTIYVVGYYSLSYSDPTQVVLAQALNGALSDAAKGAKATYINVYDAFGAAAAKGGGDSCKAGLLIPIGGGKCNIHPSRAGQQVLADAVGAAIAS